MMYTFTTKKELNDIARAEKGFIYDNILDVLSDYKAILKKSCNDITVEAIDTNVFNAHLCLINGFAFWQLLNDTYYIITPIQEPKPAEVFLDDDLY